MFRKCNEISFAPPRGTPYFALVVSGVAAAHTTSEVVPPRGKPYRVHHKSKTNAPTTKPIKTKGKQPCSGNHYS